MRLISDTPVKGRKHTSASTASSWSLVYLEYLRHEYSWYRSNRRVYTSLALWQIMPVAPHSIVQKMSVIQLVERFAKRINTLVSANYEEHLSHQGQLVQCLAAYIAYICIRQTKADSWFRVSTLSATVDQWLLGALLLAWRSRVRFRLRRSPFRVGSICRRLYTARCHCSLTNTKLSKFPGPPTVTYFIITCSLWLEQKIAWLSRKRHVTSAENMALLN